MNLEIHPDARRDLYDCASWYENRRVGLGDEFLAAYDSGIREIVSTPRLYGRTDREIPGYETRVYPIARFRHFVKYLIDGETIIVLAVDRGKRRDDDWQGRLTDRFSEPGDVV